MYRFNAIPTPSITARIIPPIMKFVRTWRQPPRTASVPPVIAPERMAFHGSSVFLIDLTAQSYALNIPPHVPKFPPNVGALNLTAERTPAQRSPWGELRNPLILYQIDPPMAPIANAPPKSLTITSGQGSRVWSPDVCVCAAMYAGKC